MPLEDAHLDDEPTWVLTDGAGARLVVARTGATALSWQVPGPDGEPVELLDGYRSAAELRAADGYRGAVLAPWSNRLRGSRYRWLGREHDLGGAADPEGLHGLVCHVPWGRVEGDDPDAETLEVWTPVAPSAGYPFAVQVRATYALGRGTDGAHRLGLTLTAVNLSDETAPVGLGWHPYVRLGDGVDALRLHVPARTHVRTDAALLPLPGAAAREPAVAAFDPLGATRLDDAFTDLRADDDGVVRTVLRAPSGASVTLEQAPTARVVHVFTGDALRRDPRASVALEPCEHVADAFNRPELTEALRLEPGRRRILEAALVYRPGLSAQPPSATPTSPAR